MRDVGDEVASDRLHPAVLGLVLGEDQDQAGAAQGGYPHRERRRVGAELADGHLDVGLADHPVAADLPGQSEEFTDDQFLSADDAEGPSGGGCAQHPVTGVEDHRGGRKRREDLGDSGRKGVAVVPWCRRLLPVGSLAEERTGDGDADDDARDEPDDADYCGEKFPLHDSIVNVRTGPLPGQGIRHTRGSSTVHRLLADTSNADWEH